MGCKAKRLAKTRGPTMATAGRSSLMSQSAPVGATAEAARRTLTNMSSNQHYLEQKLKLDGRLQEESDPLRRTCVFQGRTQELIYHGVSHDQRGRRAYLHERSKMMPQ